MVQSRLGASIFTGAVISASCLAPSPTAHADAAAYLVNVTVRPGYNFPDAQAALDYGNGVCGRVEQGTPYKQVLAVVKTDLQTDDDFQAAYLVNQAINELCPTQIWQLRQSAALYTGGPSVGG